MEQSQVKVTDISSLLGEDLPLGKKVILGSPIDERINVRLDRMKKNCSHAYVLRWEGNKVPYGAVIGTETIAWTQNGVVNNKSGKIIGTYERAIEFGGYTGREQVMVVYMF
jgi:hypothetical protein